ncbi:C-type lectin lectoxin-Enh1-like [Patiria miniata]|uniref:C-type lectin domain-containing protein n=1 Tax=Patiria miniata TaxID=46514 RepID=A0A914B4N4_PATMI|nr:C-type lectin lectoxin-Enh1-like [Patiria miniata]
MMVSKRFIFGLMSRHLMMGCSGGNEMCKASIGGRRGACPPTWIQWGGKCYKAITERLTWSEAKDECIKMGSTWKCENDEVEFRNWSTGPENPQPDNLNGEHCAEVWVDQEGKWNDAHCDLQRPAICIQPAPQLHF